MQTHVPYQSRHGATGNIEAFALELSPDLAATIMDLYSRKIVGWAIADHLRTELPLGPLRDSDLVRPDYHSDRGVQIRLGGVPKDDDKLPASSLDEPQGRLL